MIQIDVERYMLPELSVFIAIVAADAIEDAASWLNDFTIRRPPGPIRGAFWKVLLPTPPEVSNLLTGGGVADTRL